MLMERDERVRAYNLKNVHKDFDVSPTESDTSGLSDIGLVPQD